MGLAAQRVAAACLEYPGHGDEPWPLPPSTRLKDYVLLAARAAAELGRPLLIGHGMGGWLAQRLLGLANLPALLLAPWPERLGLLAAAPRLGWSLLWGLPLGPGLLKEPFGVRWQAALGLAEPAWPRKGNAPCLVAAPGKNPLVPVHRLAGLAQAMKAEIAHLPQSGHQLWQEPGQVLELTGKLAAKL
jgi:pimeloyl-ACP methyl ester carboxylesterase